MRRAMTGETKEHYKAYKAGKNWVYACITVVAVGLGLAGANVSTAQAATNVDSTPASQVVSSETPAEKASSIQAGQSNSETNSDEAAVAGSTVTQNSDVNEQNDDVNKQNNDGTKIDKQNDDADKVDVNQDADATTESTKSAETTDTQVTKPAEQNVAVDPVQPTQAPTPTPVPTVPGTPKPVTTPQPARAPQRMRAMSRMLAVVHYQGPKNLTAVPVDRAPGFDAIIGEDASVWMPDANLRTLIIQSIDQQYYGGRGIVTSANLFQYAGYVGFMKYGVNTFEQDVDYGPIKSLEGLQYFTNLQSFSLPTAELPLSGMIDFSFAPNLRTFNLFNNNNVQTDWSSMTASEVMQKYFANNSQLEYLALCNLNLTGSIPDLTAYPDLYMLEMTDNQLTGNLPDLSFMDYPVDVSFTNNQLSGQLPDMTNWTMDTLRVDNNSFYGTLPNISHISGFLYSTNHITTALVPGSYSPTAFIDGLGQTLTNGDHKLTNANNSFDPTVGLVSNFMNYATGETVAPLKLVPGKFSNGAVVVYSVDDPADVKSHNEWAKNETDASAWFKVTADPDNASGFLLVANQAAKSGHYVIKVVLENGTSTDFSAWVNFTVTNDMTTSVTPNPGVTEGSVTLVSVDQSGTVLATVKKTGKLGDTVTFDAPEVSGYTATGQTSVSGTYTEDGQTITFTYTKNDGTIVSGGDGATIDESTPKGTITKGGAAAATVTGKRDAKAQQIKRGLTAQPVSAKTNGQAATVVTATSATANQQQDAKTVLPQTNEAATGNYMLVGLATLLGALGLVGLKLKRHE